MDQYAIDLRELVLETCDEEWTQLLEEVDEIPDAAWVWKPAPKQHSLGWHVRHLVEWRYVVVHGMISELPLREKLYCLGWENDTEIKKLASNPGIWFEPAYRREEQAAFIDKIRQITNSDIASLHPGRFQEVMTFPWGRRRILDELLLEGLRHAALHRGQVRELRKAWERRDWADNSFRSGWIR